MSTVFLLALIWQYIISYTTNKAKQVLQLDAMTITGKTTQSGLSGYIAAAQYLALESINNNSVILPDYKFELKIYNTRDDKSRAIKQAIDIAKPRNLQTSTNVKDNAFRIPIMLGTSSSTESVLTNPILSAFDWSQISSWSTSTQLAELQYPTFYRTVPSDDIQSKTIVWMCQAFNWTDIVVLYYGDSYGIYLASGIHELAVKTKASNNNVKVYSISYIDRVDSILNAAQTIKQIGVFIIVLIPQISSVEMVFDIFNQEGILTFPYYYIGVDSWFQTSRIISKKISNYTKGFIGVVPWQPAVFYLDYLSYAYNGFGELYNNSIKQFHEMLSLWEWHTQNNDEFTTILKFLKVNLDVLDVGSVYGWDSAMTIVHALNIYNQMYNLTNDLQEESISNISLRLQSIIKNDSFWFWGITGNVSFHENGNRRNGLYALGNVIDDKGTIQYFGVWADEMDTSDMNISDNDDMNSSYSTACEDCTSNIVWPDEFIHHELIPRSEKLITFEVKGIDPMGELFIFILCIVSMFIVMSTIVISWRWRDREIIQAASWKLNILTCIGCLLTQFVIILYGFEPNVIWCNMREWISAISFTLVYMPLFMKTYRVSVIFTGMLTVNAINDFKLVIGVMICLLIDCIILTIFTLIEIEHVARVNGNKYEMHALHDVQQQYVYCIKNNEDRKHDVIFIFVMTAWKSLQLLFGFSVALIVSRVSLEYMQIFNETNSQIFAIMFTVVVSVAGALPVVFGMVTEPTQFYIIMGVCAVLITNVVLGANVLPRLFAVWQGEEYESKFKIKQQDAFKNAMKCAFKTRTRRSLMNIIHEAELLSIHNPKHIVQLSD